MIYIYIDNRKIKKMEKIERWRESIKSDFVEKLDSYLENPLLYNSNIFDPATGNHLNISVHNFRTQATYRLSDRFLDQGILTKEQYRQEMEAMKSFYAQKSLVAITNPSSGDNKFIHQRQKEFLIRLCICSITHYLEEYSQSSDINFKDPARVLAIKQKLEDDLQKLLPCNTISEFFRKLSIFEEQVAEYVDIADTDIIHNMMVLDSYRTLGKVPPMLDEVLNPEIRDMIQRMSMYNREYVAPSYVNRRF